MINFTLIEQQVEELAGCDRQNIQRYTRRLKHYLPDLRIVFVRTPHHIYAYSAEYPEYVSALIGYSDPESEDHALLECVSTVLEALVGGMDHG